MKNFKRNYRKFKKSHGRKYRRYKKGMKASFAIAKNNIVPDRTFVTLRYSDRRVLSSTSGTAPVYYYRGNSLYDPDLTGTGAQPNGYDQWCNFYQKYRVYASKLRIRYANIGTTAGTQAAEFVVVPLTNAPLGYSIGDLMGLPYAVHRIQNGGAANPTPYSKHFMTTSKMYGISKLKTKTDDTYEATIGANPANQWYWCLGMTSVDQLSDVNVVLYVDIEYYGEFFDRITLAKS